MSELVHRATEIADFTGRTLEGVAYRYEYPSRVTDDHWRTSYFEEILRAADRRTLAHRATFPLAQLHTSDGGAVIGEVTFDRSDDERALMFTATVDHGRPGDRLLAEIEQWSDASVTFAPLRDTYRVTKHHGRITQRAEIKIAELAIAPTGTGLAKGAEVTLVRSASGATPLLDASRRRALLL